MATTPSATVSIDAEAGSLAGGTGYCVVPGCAERNADGVPRIFASRKAILAQHGYSPAVDYVAHHIEKTRKPVIFVALPTATAGAVGRQDNSGIAGTSVPTVAGGSAGILEAVDAIVRCTKAGTLGTTGIELAVSMDGGVTEKTVKLKTAMSYTVPYLGIVITFGAGTLLVDDEFSFTTTAPMWDGDGFAAARVALAGQKKPSRSWMVIGDLPNSTFAGYVTSAVNAYETENKRFTYARAQVYDRSPLPKKSKIVGQTLSFAEVGVSGDTLTRSAGSWLKDGFKVGDKPTISGSVSNDGTKSAGIAALTDTVMTFATDDLVAEVATPSEDVTITVEQTMAAYVSEADAAFSSVDSQKRIDLGLGRLVGVSPIHGWALRRPVQWAASIREYQKDIHITTWRKEDGPLDGWSMQDEHGNVTEYDQDTDGGALEARFTCARTWGNGPEGAFIAQSLTRADESTVLSLTHNMAVANVFCTIVQAATENFVGKTPQVDDDGHPLAAELTLLEESVNTDAEIALMQEKVAGAGPRASKAVWKADPTSVLNVPDATLLGAGDLRVNGTIVHVDTAVKVG